MRARDADALAAFGGSSGEPADRRGHRGSDRRTFIEAVVAPGSTTMRGRSWRRSQTCASWSPSFERRAARSRVAVDSRGGARAGARRGDRGAQTGPTGRRPEGRDETQPVRGGMAGAPLRLARLRAREVEHGDLHGADRTLAIGAGQMSRVDAVNVAVMKAAQQAPTCCAARSPRLTRSSPFGTGSTRSPPPARPRSCSRAARCGTRKSSPPPTSTAWQWCSPVAALSALVRTEACERDAGSDVTVNSCGKRSTGRVVGHGRHADRLGRIPLADVARHAGGGGARAHGRAVCIVVRAAQRRDPAALLRRRHHDGGDRAARRGEGGRVRVMVRGRGIEPLPGVRRWLARLRDTGWRQAVASSAPPANIEVIIEVLGLDCFDAWVSAEEVAHGKPAPDVFLRAAEKLGVAPARSVVVEDAPAGVKAGGAAACARSASPPWAGPSMPTSLSGRSKTCPRMRSIAWWGTTVRTAVSIPAPGEGGCVRASRRPDETPRLFNTTDDCRLATLAGIGASARPSCSSLAGSSAAIADFKGYAASGASCRGALRALDCARLVGPLGFTGPFREHPIGILVIPRADRSDGLPGAPGRVRSEWPVPLVSIVLVQLIAAHLVRPRDARALGWMVQLMPIAFVFRIRANQDTRC